MFFPLDLIIIQHLLLIVKPKFYYHFSHGGVSVTGICPQYSSRKVPLGSELAVAGGSQLKLLRGFPRMAALVAIIHDC